MLASHAAGQRWFWDAVCLCHWCQHVSPNPSSTLPLSSEILFGGWRDYCGLREPAELTQAHLSPLGSDKQTRGCTAAQFNPFSPLLSPPTTCLCCKGIIRRCFWKSSYGLLLYVFWKQWSFSYFTKCAGKRSWAKLGCFFGFIYFILITFWLHLQHTKVPGPGSNPPP